MQSAQVFLGLPLPRWPTTTVVASFLIVSFFKNFSPKASFFPACPVSYSSVLFWSHFDPSISHKGFSYKKLFTFFINPESIFFRFHCHCFPACSTCSTCSMHDFFHKNTKLLFQYRPLKIVKKRRDSEGKIIHKMV